MTPKSVLDLSDAELSAELGGLTARALQVLDEYHRRHPDEPVWTLLAISLRESPYLQLIDDKRRLAMTPPASKRKQ